MTGRDADLQAIEEQEARLYAGLTASDADLLDSVMSEDVTYIHSTSIAETKAENLAGQRHGVHRHGPITTISKHTRIVGDMAVTRGMIDMVDVAHGKDFTLRLRQTLIWIREGGEWRLLVRQATRLPL